VGLSSLKVVQVLLALGLTAGLASCVRGLFDTDGCVFSHYGRAQMAFSSRCNSLLQDFRDSLLALGLTPSRISDKNVYLCREERSELYVEQIGFGNPKHYQRYQQFKGE